MASNPSIRKASVKNEKIVVLHECNQTETLKHLAENTKRLSEIITGNGDPEKGISRKVAIIGERQGAMSDKLNDIHDSLSSYHKEIETAKEVALTVKSAFEKYQASLQGEEVGKVKASTRKQVTFSNAVNVISTLVIVGTLIYTIMAGGRETNKLNDKINNLGTPVIVNARGVPQKLPAGDSLKFFRDGEFKDTIRDKEAKP